MTPDDIIKIMNELADAFDEQMDPREREAFSRAITALSAPSRDIPEGWVIPPDEWVRDYAKKHCTVRTGDHWKADAWNLKCAFRAWAAASPPPPAQVRDIPEGWVMVPREPTRNQIMEAHFIARDDLDPTEDELRDFYTAMVAATPPASESK